MNGGILARDGTSGRLLGNTAATGLRFNGGTPCNPARELIVTTTAPVAAYVAGLPYDAAGALCVENAARAASAPGGIPITASGRVAMSFDQSVLAFHQGLPFDAASRLASKSLAGASDPFFANVTLLAINENGANGTTVFIDQSPLAKAITREGNAAWSNTNPPAGLTTTMGTSAGDLVVAGGAGFDFGTGAFTIECFYRSSVAGRQDIIGGDFDAPSNAQAFSLISNVVANRLDWYEIFNLRINGGPTIADGAWHHLAVSRQGNNVRMFVDGVQRGATFVTAFTYGNATARFGIGFQTTGAFVNGWMASVRVTKGVARYTANFTVPTLPLPTS